MASKIAKAYRAAYEFQAKTLGLEVDSFDPHNEAGGPHYIETETIDEYTSIVKERFLCREMLLHSAGSLSIAARSVLFSVAPVETCVIKISLQKGVISLQTPVSVVLKDIQNDIAKCKELSMLEIEWAAGGKDLSYSDFVDVLKKHQKRFKKLHKESGLKTALRLHRTTGETERVLCKDDNFNDLDTRITAYKNSGIILPPNVVIEKCQRRKKRSDALEEILPILRINLSASLRDDYIRGVDDDSRFVELSKGGSIMRFEMLKDV